METAVSVIDAATKTLIQTGFSQLSATVTDVMGMAVPTAVTIIALTAGISFAFKQLKGVISKAA